MSVEVFYSLVDFFLFVMLLCLVRRTFFFMKSLLRLGLFLVLFCFGDGRFISLFLGAGGILVFAFLFYLLWISDFFRYFFAFLLIKLPIIVLIGVFFFLWGFLWLYLLYRDNHKKRLVIRDFSDYSIYPFFAKFFSFLPHFFAKFFSFLPHFFRRFGGIVWNINIYLFLYGVLVYFTICLLFFTFVLFYYVFLFLYPDGFFYPFFKEIPWELFFSLGFDLDLLKYFYAFVLKLVGLQKERSYNIYNFFVRYHTPLFEGGRNRLRWPKYGANKLPKGLDYFREKYGIFVSVHYVFFNSVLRFPVIQVVLSLVFGLLVLEWSIYRLYRANRHLSNFKSPKEAYRYKFFVKKLIFSVFFGFFLLFLSILILYFFLVF